MKVGLVLLFFAVLSSVARSASATPSCPRGKKRQECGPACPLSCDNYGTTVDCTLRCVPGCFCPEGTAELKGWCVHPSVCPARCPRGKEWRDCGSACPLTCDNYNTTVQCTLQCVPGCFCPRGTVVDSNGDCVRPSDCPARCPLLTAPTSGMVEVTGNTVGSTATYSCNFAFELNGVRSRTCQSSETWSNDAPTCELVLICRRLTSPANGRVVVSGLTPGSTAQYSCDQGYELSGVQTRRCQSGGTWSGAPPTCGGQCVGGCQCFSSTTCGGTGVEAHTLRECCVGTSEGLSWRSGDGSCTACVVHGFSDIEIRRDEGGVWNGSFRFFVKGESSGAIPADILLGTITDVPDTAQRLSDYTYDGVDVDMEYGFTDSVTWRLTLSDDSLALEYDDTLDLEYTSSIGGFDHFEATTPPQFIRTSVRIHIVDTDDLRFRYNLREYDTDENVGEITGIILRFGETQENFIVAFTPATIDESIDDYSLSELLDLERFEDETQKATAGQDFDASTFSHLVTAGSRTLAIGPVSIRDDDVNENEQFFVLVARILGHASDSACFQLVIGDPCSTIGGAVLRIWDDDPMLIGFNARRTTVRENLFPTQSRFPVFLNIISNRRSELDYVVTINEGRSTATVSAVTEQTGDWDFAFGLRESTSGRLFLEGTFYKNNTEFARAITFVNNDLHEEETEDATIMMSLKTVQNLWENPRCLTDDENPSNYFCTHTVSIMDEDEPLEVSFERTLYEVNEDAGQVEICVNLTKPATEIFDNVVGVEVFEDDDIKTNEHIPVGAAIADGTGSDPDYDRQRFGRNQLRRQRIAEENRRICYNQTIYDDVRMEPTEYAGLTLQVRDSVTTIRTEVGIEHTAIKIVDND